jgi:hypothetical protein
VLTAANHRVVIRLFGVRINPPLLWFSALILVVLILSPELISISQPIYELHARRFCFQWETDILTLHIVRELPILIASMSI